MYVCVCCYMCLCVWILMQNNLKLIWDWTQSNLLFSFVGFPAQPLFFFFWLTALPLDLVLRECGHYHCFVTRQIFSQHVFSMNISSHTVLICFDVSDSSLDRISCVIFFPQIKEMSQSPGISYLSVQKIQGYKV